MFLETHCWPSTSQNGQSVEETEKQEIGKKRRAILGTLHNATNLFHLSAELIRLRHLLTVFIFLAFPPTIHGYYRSSLQGSDGHQQYSDLMSAPKEPCYSCFSHAYLPIWNLLMIHYYPPHNFTDRCWQPDAQIGTVPCDSACFTIVERVAGQNEFMDTEHQAVMRGCVDRFLLFGLDADVKMGLMPVDRRHTNVCKKSSRKILKMYSLTSSESDLVYLCTCVGPRCNEQDMLNKPDTAPRAAFLSNSFSDNSIKIEVRGRLPRRHPFLPSTSVEFDERILLKRAPLINSPSASLQCSASPIFAFTHHHHSMISPSTIARQFHRCLSTVSTDSTRYIVSVSEIRKRLREEGHLRKCSPSDIHLIDSEDVLLFSFLHAFDGDVDVVFAVVLEWLKWRHQFDVEHLSMLSLKPLFDRRFMYVHGKDVEGNPILWIQMREHRPGDRVSEQLFVYWLERHYFATRGSPLTLVVDMTGCSVKNMDFDLFKFILHALKFYYPLCVQDIIIFDSPSILNASWKVIRSWLGAGHPQIHQVARESVQQYIPYTNLPVHMGGLDEWTFSMEELARCVPQKLSPMRESLAELLDDDQPDTRPDLDSFPVKRTVKFDDDEDETGRKAPLTVSRRSSSRGAPTKRSSSRSGMPQNLRPMAERRVHAPDSDWVKNAFLATSPREELFLQRLEGDTDYVDLVAIRNTGSNNVMFKIKTTSPEKFRVRPSTGLIPAGVTESVRVYLQNEYRQSASREKFLLLGLETESTSVEQFSDLWKEAKPEKKVEQKLKCRVNLPPGEQNGTVNGHTQIDQKRETLKQPLNLQDEVERLAAGQRALIWAIGFLFFIQIWLLMSDHANTSSLSSAIVALQEAQLKSHQQQHGEL
ncbi:unnamed protein product, partial [Mesorhabditis belari]|uniref:Major sperm protein n=1 Tax=Mesorhabditis belari TaxID=2138241 RepID=A0AAF3E9U1_9BILA